MQRAGATTWLAQFMAGVKERNYRVDYLCFHFYSQPGEITMDPFLEWLGGVNSTYPEYFGKIWITEFGNNTNSKQGNIQFYENVYDILSKGKYEGMVSRYSWFTNRWSEKPDYGWDLINSQGRPTELGKIYASYPK